MTKMKALIVDDEPLARARLRRLLVSEPTVEILGECGDGPEAIAAIKRDRPDLLFLDVRMPGCDGLQVLAELPPERRPAVIFVTAYEHFALDAFNVQAVDYLLKPFDQERLHTALVRAAHQIQIQRSGAPAEGAPGPAGLGPADRLAVKADGKVILVRPDEIQWVEAADNYVILHLADRNLITRETLSALETKLGPARFARINRSALVHLDQVKELHPSFHGDYIVILRNGVRLPLSRALRGRLGGFLTGQL